METKTYSLWNLIDTAIDDTVGSWEFADIKDREGKTIVVANDSVRITLKEEVSK